MEATEGKRPRLLRPIEVAQVLGISRRAVFDLFGRGLPQVRVGPRATRVLEADLEKFIADRRTSA